MIDPSGHWSFDVGSWHVSGSDKDAGTAAIIVVTAVATYYCAGTCTVAVYTALEMALVGEVAGAAYAASTGGDVQQGVIVGGVIGGTMGYFGGEYLAGTEYPQVADISLKIYGTTALTISDNLAIAMIGGGTTWGILSAFGNHGGGGGGGGRSSGSGGTYTQGGTTFNSNGVPIGEVGIEEPNPLLDPVNYAGGLAGIGYKTDSEITLFKGLRVAPFGNRTPNPYGKWPHYHRNVPNPTKPGQSIPGQGIGRHRPWETKSPDKSFWDRF